MEKVALGLKTSEIEKVSSVCLFRLLFLSKLMCRSSPGQTGLLRAAEVSLTVQHTDYYVG